MRGEARLLRNGVTLSQVSADMDRMSTAGCRQHVKHLKTELLSLRGRQKIERGPWINSLTWVLSETPAWRKRLKLCIVRLCHFCDFILDYLFLYKILFTGNYVFLYQEIWVYITGHCLKPNDGLVFQMRDRPSVSIDDWGQSLAPKTLLSILSR